MISETTQPNDTDNAVSVFMSFVWFYKCKVCFFYSLHRLEFEFIFLNGLVFDSFFSYYFLLSVSWMGWGVMIVNEPGYAGTRFVMFLLLPSRQNRFVIIGRKS